jgi:hypothetical protein
LGEVRRRGGERDMAPIIRFFGVVAGRRFTGVMPPPPPPPPPPTDDGLLLHLDLLGVV